MIKPWAFTNIEQGKKYTLPPGKYYIGDLYFAIEDEQYHNILGPTQYNEGIYKSKYGSFIMGNARSGERYLKGSDDVKYDIDSGNIAIVTKSLIETNEIVGGKIYNFIDDVNVIINKGLFTITSTGFKLIIDASDEVSDDEYPTPMEIDA